MGARHAVPLALCAILFAPSVALAQSAAPADRPPPPVDFKPLIPPVIPPPLLPPNSVLTPGSVRDGSQGLGTPLYDPTQNQATPGFRLTIPTR